MRILLAQVDEIDTNGENMPHESDVANVATIALVLNEFNEKYPNEARWKITYNKDAVHLWSKTSEGWSKYTHYSWKEIRIEWNCGFRNDYRWLEKIVSHDEAHRKHFFEAFYGESAVHVVGWDLEPWTRPPSAPYQYMSGGKLYWSDLPR